MKRGATLFISVPFVWRVHAYPNDYWRMTTEGVRSLFSLVEWDAVLYANQSLTAKDYIKPLHKAQGVHPYFPRTEVLAFGRMAAK